MRTAIVPIVAIRIADGTFAILLAFGFTEHAHAVRLVLAIGIVETTPSSS
jgi:hypothetical protein